MRVLPSPDKSATMRDNGRPNLPAEVNVVRNFSLVILAFLVMISAAAAQQPASIEPPAGERLLLKLQASGVQIYACVTDAGTASWKFKAPEARLSGPNGADAGSHSAGPTWKLADGSEIKGSAVASKPAPDPGSVPWLLLKVASHSGEGQLTKANYVTRTDTKGGVAPQSGCDAGHQGQEARVPYTATYSFYGQ